MPTEVPPEAPKLTVDEKIDHYATMYGVRAETMHATIKCESNYIETAHNKSDPMGGAKGIAQFLQPTFNHYSKLAGAEPDIWNTDAQLQTMAYMFSIGEAKQWTCYRKVGRPSVL